MASKNDSRGINVGESVDDSAEGGSGARATGRVLVAGCVGVGKFRVLIG